MFTVTVTLTSAGASTGPFNIFSNVSTPAFSSALNASPVSRIDILAGVTLSNVPDGTTVLRVQSIGDCKNSIDIDVTPPDQCASFIFQGGPTKGNVITYRDCETGLNISVPLDDGASIIRCAYSIDPYYPAFTSGIGTILPSGTSCSASKNPCKQYLLYAFPGEGGVTFRYIPCDETDSIEVIVSDGETSVICANPYFVPQMVSGSGSATDTLSGCTTTTTTSTSTSTSTTTTTSTTAAP